MDSEQVKNVVHAFLTLFPTRAREKNDHNLLHFYGTLQLEVHMNIQQFLYPDKICYGLNSVTVYFLYIYIFIYFIKKKTQGKALSPKGFYVNNIWKILHSVCPGWIPNLSTHIREKFPQDSASLFKRNILFSSEPIHIFASYADCS